jgi:hypothetical protein
MAIQHATHLTVMGLERTDSWELAIVGGIVEFGLHYGGRYLRNRDYTASYLG